MRLYICDVTLAGLIPFANMKDIFLQSNSDRKGEGGLRTQGYYKKLLPDKPLVSVITVVFNGDEHLEEMYLYELRIFLPYISLHFYFWCRSKKSGSLIYQRISACCLHNSSRFEISR